MLSVAFSRLFLKDITKTSRGICTTNGMLIRTTPILLAEPLKKKKKIDPQVIKQREDRRKKKLEKQIRRLEKVQRTLKPIEELEVPLHLIDEKKIRTRTNIVIATEEIERRNLLQKKWAYYKLKDKVANFQIIDRLNEAHEKALNELRKESEELYQEAIQPDFKLLPYTTSGPVATPPIKKYESPDGEYSDISKKWE